MYWNFSLPSIWILIFKDRTSFFCRKHSNVPRITSPEKKRQIIEIIITSVDRRVNDNLPAFNTMGSSKKNIVCFQWVGVASGPVENPTGFFKSKKTSKYPAILVSRTYKKN